MRISLLNRSVVERYAVGDSGSNRRGPVQRPGPSLGRAVAAAPGNTPRKTEMLQLRLMEKQRVLVRRDDANELLDTVCGVVLTHLSGMAARCSRDMVVRRKIDAVVFQVRTELAQVCNGMADERAEPPPTTKIVFGLGACAVAFYRAMPVAHIAPLHSLVGFLICQHDVLQCGIERIAVRPNVGRNRRAECYRDVSFCSTQFGMVMGGYGSQGTDGSQLPQQRSM